MAREQLEEKAKELGIEFNDDTGDDDLEKMIKDKDVSSSKKTKDPDYLESELKKVIDQRDKVKDERRRLQNKINEMEKQLGNMVNPDDFKSLKEELTQLKEFKSEIDKQREEEEWNKKTEIEKLKYRAEQAEEKASTFEEQLKKFEGLDTKVQELSEQLGSKDKTIQKLRGYSLENEVIKSAQKNNAIEPGHIYRMLKNEFEFDNDLGRFTFVDRDDKGKVKREMDVDEYVKEFLSAEENDYLVKADANTESMHTRETSDRKKKASTDGYNPNDPNIKAAAERENMDVKDYIETLKFKDAKMRRVKGTKDEE